MSEAIKDKRGIVRNITCSVVGCDSVRQKHGRYPSGTQKYHSKCSHHIYLSRKGLSLDTETRNIEFRGGSERKVCQVAGCTRMQVSKGKDRYDIYCTSHRSLEKQGLPLTLNIDECSVCGWDGPCDKHRIKPGKDGGEYTIDNVVVVCPNCHRDYHRGVDPYSRLRMLHAI